MLGHLDIALTLTTLMSTLKSWHTSAINNADNNSKPLPHQYSILFLKIVSLINTFLLLHCSFYYLVTLYFVYILDSFLFVFFLSIQGCSPTAERSDFIYLYF